MLWGSYGRKLVIALGHDGPSSQDPKERKKQEKRNQMGWIGTEEQQRRRRLRLVFIGMRRCI